MLITPKIARGEDAASLDSFRLLLDKGPKVGKLYRIQKHSNSVVLITYAKQMTNHGHFERTSLGLQETNYWFQISEGYVWGLSIDYLDQDQIKWMHLDSSKLLELFEECPQEVG